MRQLRGMNPDPAAKAKRARSHKEDDLQAAVCAWLDVAYPDLLYYAVPNGGRRAVKEAVRLKKQGVKAGVYDLAFVIPKQTQYAAFGQAAFIELKTEGGRLSAEQHDFARKLDRACGWHAVCRSVDDVCYTLAVWGVQSREVDL